VPNRRFLAGVIACTIIAVALTLWYYPSSTDFAVSNTHWNGLSDISRQLSITPFSLVDRFAAERRGTALLIIPARPPQSEHLRLLRTYVETGGVLVLLDDFGFGNDILAFLGSEIRFSGQLLADPLFNLRNSRLPRILDIAPSPITQGVEGLILNHATVLTGISQLRGVALSSPVSYLDVNQSGIRDEGDPVGPFSVAALEPLGEGYLVVVSDPSILINSMVRLAHNRRFLSNAFGLAGANARSYLDDALLPQAPLDVAKNLLADIRRFVAWPPAAFALVVAALLLPAVLLSKPGREVAR
jgi:hypothetical protein